MIKMYAKAKRRCWHLLGMIGVSTLTYTGHIEPLWGQDVYNFYFQKGEVSDEKKQETKKKRNEELSLEDVVHSDQENSVPASEKPDNTSQTNDAELSLDSNVKNWNLGLGYGTFRIPRANYNLPPAEYSGAALEVGYDIERYLGLRVSGIFGQRVNEIVDAGISKNSEGTIANSVNQLSWSAVARPVIIPLFGNGGLSFSMLAGEIQNSGSGLPVDRITFWGTDIEVAFNDWISIGYRRHYYRIEFGATESSTLLASARF